jgi:hypothetical protein
MQSESYKKQRRKEVMAGLILIVMAFSYLASLLLNFDFVSPYATLQEDLNYLANHLQNQQISVWSWLVTSFVTFLAIPFYLMVFHGRLKFLHYLNGLLVLGASTGFLIMGITGLELHQELSLQLSGGNLQMDEEVRIRLLKLFRDEVFYRHVASSCIGAFAIGLALTRIKMKMIPLFATLLLLISGPTMIFFNWYSPDHVIKTAAMTGILIGMSIFSVRLINRGL